MFKRKSDVPVRGYSYSLLPSKSHERKLLGWIGSCRFVYNAGLEHRIACFGLQEKKFVGYSEQQNSLPEVKADPDFFWLKDVPSQSLQLALQNLDKAFSRFFKTKKGFPRFKKRGHRNSITFPQGVEIISVNGKYAQVFIPKLGILNCILHRKIKGKIKNATISYSLGEGWTISFCVEQMPVPMPAPKGVPIGIDLGIAKTIATSEEMDFHLPVTSLKKLEERIENCQ